MMAGLACGSLGMAIYGLAPTGELFWVSVPIMAMWGVVGPSLADMMSRHVSESEQGQLQGANSSAQSITGLIGPAIFTTTFAWLLGWLPGAPFLLAALLLLLAACVTWLVTTAAPGDASS